MIFALSNSLLYVCFAIVVGGCLLSLIPADKRPAIQLPKRWLVGSVMLIPVFAVVPVLYLTEGVNGYREEPFFQSFLYILYNVETGRAWSALLFLCIFLLVLIKVMYNRLTFPVVYAAGLFLVFGMIITHSVVGHAANMGSYAGASAHIIHFMAVSAWLGVLLVSSWFSTNDDNWEEFTGWYTPMAIGCVVIVSFSGMFMTFFLTENLVNSWMLTYGQALLLKHLLFIPLLIYALINGFLMKRKIKKVQSFSPRQWWKVESLVVIAIFVVTAFMSEQEPPHNISQTIAREGGTGLLSFLFPLPVGPEMELLFRPDWLSFLFIATGFVFLFLIIFAFKQNVPALRTFLISMMAVSSIYLGVINSLEVDKDVETTTDMIPQGQEHQHK